MLHLTAETRHRLKDQDPLWRINLSLRATSTFLAFIDFLLFAITTGLSVHYYGGTDWMDAMPLTPVLLALLYNPIHIIALLVLSKRSPYPTTSTSSTGRWPVHPAWPLTVDTLIWVLAIPSMVYSIKYGWFTYWTPIGFEFDGLVPCFIIEDEFSKLCNPMIYTLGKMEIAANVFLGLILILHFTLFFFSIISAHKHRLARRKSRPNIELQHQPPSPTAPPKYAPPATFGAQPGHARHASTNTGPTSSSRTAVSPTYPTFEPKSPVNSGSAGGFGASVAVREGRMSNGTDVDLDKDVEADTNPFADVHAVKYS